MERKQQAQLIFEKSAPGRRGYTLPPLDIPEASGSLSTEISPEQSPPFPVRSDLPFPEVSELDLVRHYVVLSQKNHAVDTGFYPLGSCTMKYNPKVNEEGSSLPGFTMLHPLQPLKTVQGALALLWELEQSLCEIAGMDAFTLQPAAGAQGELTGLLMIKKYFQEKKEARTLVLVPDSAHGTNPATASMAGFQVVQIPSCRRGGMDLEAFRQALTEKVAALMLTNPNTLGLFDEHILTFTSLAHEKGAVLYYDGANLNAILGKTRPGDLGFDIVHLNLHKTFSTPHGGGGPGAGPVGVKKFLEPYLPLPRIVKKEVEDLADLKDLGDLGDLEDPAAGGAAKGRLKVPPKAGVEEAAAGGDDSLQYEIRSSPQDPSPQGVSHSIGRMKAFYGNFLLLVRAYLYIRHHGSDGLRHVAEMAVLNANYLMSKLREWYDLPFERSCMHEFVLSGKKQKAFGVKTLDMAKALLDYGFHAPTIYFPLLVEEAMLIEPTETESRETLDAFVNVMREIAEKAERSPEVLREAPYTTPVRRLDEAAAARKPLLTWRPSHQTA